MKKSKNIANESTLKSPGSKKFSTQLLILMAIALVCGLLLAGVRLLVGDSGGGGNSPEFYAEIYSAGENTIYKETEDFNEISNTYGTVLLKATERIDVYVLEDDGSGSEIEVLDAVIFRILATSGSNVDFDLYVAVKDGSVKVIYVNSRGSTTWLAETGLSYNSKTKKIAVSSINSIMASGATHTKNTFDALLIFAVDIA